jgi:hypothetical protein
MGANGLMKLNFICILLLIFIFIPKYALGQKYTVQAETSEVTTYKINTHLQYSLLHMDYASSIIQDTEAWSLKNKKILEVDIVFTAYPKKKQDWLTNYDWLLNKRIEALKTLEPSLKDPLIKWNFILQTACETEEEAKRMFHGAIIKYTLLKSHPKQPSNLGMNTDIEAEVINNSIETVVYGLSSFEDSVVFKTLNRNCWGEMLIINDWTGSMYQYGAQAVLWHRLNFEKNTVKYFVFFNDGNKKLDRQKRIGNTGGIYYAKPDSIEYILKVMKFVAKRGSGGDIPENNIEAILKGIKLFKGYDELVMIADNKAGVRDMLLLEKVNIPIRVILCGAKFNQPIHPHYLEIARKTNGSVHTLEEDITDLQHLKEGEKINLLGIEYIVKKGKLVERRKKVMSYPEKKVLSSF